MCLDGVESFQCMCSPVFTGMSCGTNMNECETIGCVNGTCTDLNNAWVIVILATHATVDESIPATTH